MIHRSNRRSAATFIFAAAASGSLLSLTAFSQPAATPSTDADPVVARVLKTEIRSSQKMHLNGIIFGTLLEKYARDHGLSASEEEITKFRLKVWPSESKEAIRSQSEVARNAIVVWKRDLALFRTYGGRVIFQQMGPEPIDAYRAFLEEQARLGTFEIIDKSLEAGFWAYFISDKHIVMSSTKSKGEEVLGTPLWEKK